MYFQIQLTKFELQTMDMRKLIDETEFENMNELSKRWKKESGHTSLADSNVLVTSNVNQKVMPTHEKASTTNMLQQSNGQLVEVSSSEAPRRKREILPQVIDEDTEHFRNRLQHLLNTFKTDAVSEFMTMKKSVLDYQKDCVKSDTQRYLTMYEEKHQELLQTKDKLITLTTDVQRKGMQVELMSSHIAKLNDRIRITKYLSRPFALLYENKERQKMIKFKMNEAAKSDTRRLKIRAFNGMRNICRETQKEKQETAVNRKIQMEVADIVGRFQKEMEMLREKLAQTTRKNEEYENSKYLIQDNLKKAFLRGISSMNMEAMGIFGAGLQSEPKKGQSDLIAMNNSYIQQNQMGFSRTMNNQHLNHTTINAMNVQSNSSVIVNKAIIQSKDHKWKEAPILGMEEKLETEEPRPQLVKPTAQGKVIKVVDGKSTVQPFGSKKTVNNVTSSQKTQTVSKKKT